MSKEANAQKVLAAVSANNARPAEPQASASRRAALVILGLHEEVAALVEESRGEGLLAQHEYDRLSGALDFTEKTVASVVMPATGLTTVPRGATAAEVEEVCAATGYSRFPVTGETGELVGYLHIKDVLEYDEDRRDDPIADRWIRPFAVLGSEDTLRVGLATLQRRGAHMARVVDAGGAMLGLVALEDVIEELVGQIKDAAHHEDPA